MSEQTQRPDPLCDRWNTQSFFWVTWIDPPRRARHERVSVRGRKGRRAEVPSDPGRGGPPAAHAAEDARDGRFRLVGISTDDTPEVSGNPDPDASRPRPDTTASRRVANDVDRIND
ncbi:hypothetical protein [Umezawaea sp. Da 62-37]|uniref:hypothetical protein n=1 Tax=Umezawaea sp. Da 62-37 TaxID=3075927 RepID=UPI0028F74E88|nr:hypothetical protein [Umezawaea sp. Da 62-37]WNV90715.1 hypothetical protein RM788_21265 [Umezawaea sp. Da 62-37]